MIQYFRPGCSRLRLRKLASKWTLLTILAFLVIYQTITLLSYTAPSDLHRPDDAIRPKAETNVWTELGNWLAQQMTRQGPEQRNQGCRWDGKESQAEGVEVELDNFSIASCRSVLGLSVMVSSSSKSIDIVDSISQGVPARSDVRVFWNQFSCTAFNRNCDYDHHLSKLQTSSSVGHKCYWIGFRSPPTTQNIFASPTTSNQNSNVVRQQTHCPPYPSSCRNHKQCPCKIQKHVKSHFEATTDGEGLISWRRERSDNTHVGRGNNGFIPKTYALGFPSQPRAIEPNQTSVQSLNDFFSYKSCVGLDGDELNKCKGRHVATVFAYLVLGVVGFCALSLVVLECLRRRHTKATPLFSAGKTEFEQNIAGPMLDGLPQYTTPDSHSNPQSRRKLTRTQGGGTEARQTLDGTTDGWTSWILHTRENLVSHFSKNATLFTSHNCEPWTYGCIKYLLIYC